MDKEIDTMFRGFSISTIIKMMHALVTIIEVDALVLGNLGYNVDTENKTVQNMRDILKKMEQE